MLYIDEHKEQALQDIIPYLLQFQEVYNLAEQSGDRYQKIEDIAWELLYSLDFENASGVWLDYLGKKVGQSRTYTPVPQNAFTFGRTSEEGFGKGKFKGTSSVKSTKQARTDYSFLNAIRAKIIQNNTDASLDELMEACKLLFNVGLIRIEESYPASINTIQLYGKALLETQDAYATIKSILPAGVSLNKVTFHKFYNLFKNNAFITYDKYIPATDDFELSFIIKPDIAVEDGTAILSQDISFSSEFMSIECYYDSESGIVFKTSANYYHDNNTGTTKYNDELENAYLDSESDVFLVGGRLSVNNETAVKIAREGNVWSLYINGTLTDYEESDHKNILGDNVKLYLGTSNGKYFNSGSIYNLLLVNKTTDEILINDSLKEKTIGINNGVRFL